MGFSQRETNVAWCGTSVLVVYGDTGSPLQTSVLGGGVSSIGYSLSIDGGDSFRDLGYLPPGPDTATFVRGAAVAACSSLTQFYVVSPMDFSPDGGTTYRSGIGLWRSTDGGATFDDPTPIVSQPAGNYSLDFAWLAIDPATPTSLHVTFTELSSGGPGCSNGSSVQWVSSTDGGLTWGAPIVLDQLCDDSTTLQGSSVVVDRSHAALVAWATQSWNEPYVTGQIRSSRVAEGSASPPIVAASVIGPGSSFMLQGGAYRRVSLSLAMDVSKGRRSGTAYIAWNDGHRNSVADPFGGRYAYSDVLMVASPDSGRTWPRPATRVNRNAEPTAGVLGTDQFLPTVAVDKTGRLAACYYDRRRDPRNFLMERYCSVSSDGGTRWRAHRESTTRWPFLWGVDVGSTPEAGFGDHDGLAADFLGATKGFRGAYGEEASGRTNVKSTLLQD